MGECSLQVGTATAMAAAGLCAVLGGRPEQAAARVATIGYNMLQRFSSDGVCTGECREFTTSRWKVEAAATVALESPGSIRTCFGFWSASADLEFFSYFMDLAGVSTDHLRIEMEQYEG